MKYTLFVEGEYDKILFERQIKPLFKDLGHEVEFFEWAQSPDRVTTGYINSINQFPSSKTYIFFTDLDSQKTIEDKKNELLTRFKQLERSKICIVCKEIEGWYLGGLSREDALSIQINLSQYDTLDPNTINKETFVALKPPFYLKTKIFYIDVANLFQIFKAQQRNISFNLFFNIFITNA